MIRNAITVADAVGAAAALVAAAALSARRVRAESFAVAAILLAVVWQGLTPAIPRHSPATLYWIPFAGALIGDLLSNVRATADKLFLYGTALWLMNRIGWSWAKAAGVVASIAAFVEIGQIFLLSGTPEITDPLLVVGLAVLFSKWTSIFPSPPQSQPA